MSNLLVTKADAYGRILFINNRYFLTGCHGHFYPHPLGFLFPASSRRSASTSAPPSRDWEDAVRLDTNTQTDWRPDSLAPSHRIPRPSIVSLSVMSSPESVMHQHTARSSEKLKELGVSAAMVNKKAVTIATRIQYIGAVFWYTGIQKDFRKDLFIPASVLWMYS